jgi:mannose-6-phosphate isomerase-like protein (cupin superfamily)
MNAHEISALLKARRETSSPYSEFLRAPSLSAGIYELPAKGVDRQSPHGEDEIYYVLAGRATIRVGGEDRDVAPGSLVYVPARVEHAFHAIRERLSLLVFFAPAEGSRARTSESKRRRHRRRDSKTASSRTQRVRR